jgi:hypothetical protein
MMYKLNTDGVYDTSHAKIFCIYKDTYKIKSASYEDLSWLPMSKFYWMYEADYREFKKYIRKQKNKRSFAIINVKNKNNFLRMYCKKIINETS